MATSYKELGLVNTKEMFEKRLKADMQFLLLILTIWNKCKL